MASAPGKRTCRQKISGARQQVGAILSVWLERRGYNEISGAHPSIVGPGLTARGSPDICQADYMQWDEQSVDVRWDRPESDLRSKENDRTS
jgi:hypothetical protein